MDNKSEEFVRNFYRQSAKFILTLPFILNAGSALALAHFFEQNSNSVSFHITIAATAFILGTLIGVIILIHEYFVAYFTLSRFAKDGTKPESEALKKIVLWQIIIGTLSLACWIIGIYFVIVLIQGNYCLIALIFFILFFLALFLIILTKHNIIS